MRSLCYIVVVLAILCPSQGLRAAGDSKLSDDPLHRASYKEIVAKYTFVGDFHEKPLERTVSDELFWRYPLKIQPISFDLESDFRDIAAELPSIKGMGMVYQHLNLGRVLYLEGKYDEAKKVWLSARARYGTTYKEHRFTDYLLGYVFLKLAAEGKKTRNLSLKDSEYRQLLANAATFLSWAYIVKKDAKSEVLDAFAPKALYNLATIYFTVGRHAAAYGAAQEGLDFLRKTGQKTYRPQLHRMVTEALIKNQSWLESVQQLDLGIRQDQDPKQGSAMFARVGDIYFNLNNYELAEDAYALANRIDQEQEQVHPAQFILRGEALFWLGRFSDAQKILYYGLNSHRVMNTPETIPRDMMAFGQLRIADAYLARKEFDKAKLEYFRVTTDYRGTEAANLAKVRSACLELPFYQGNNIAHARVLLDEVKSSELPSEAKELAWACHVSSYTERERTVAMVDRVRSFAGRYPESRFLRSMAEPVRTVQASHIEDYFSAGDIFKAIAFYETNKKLLFPKVSPELQRKLFAAYVDVMKSEGARPFWKAYSEGPQTDFTQLRMVTMASEVSDLKGFGEFRPKAAALSQQLRKRHWTIDPSDAAESLVARTMATKSRALHAPWVMALADFWTESDSRFVCSLVYPLLSRPAGPPPPIAKSLLTIDRYVARLAEKTKAEDRACLISFLELEQKILARTPGQIGVRYLSRLNWKLDGDLVGLFWGAAEQCHTAGNKACAITLWQHVRDKSPPNAPEGRLSQARLDPSRTQLDGLWDN